MKKLSIPILSVITSISAAAALGLRIICLFFFYDSIGYYQTGAILPIIANIIFALAVVFLLVTAIFSIDKAQSVEPPSKLSQYAAVLPIGALVFRITRIFTPVFNDTNVNKILMLFGALAAIAFFFLIFLAKKSYKNVTFYLGIGALVYVFLCWMYTYFDFSIPINSTDKIFFYLGCAGAIIFIFNEMCAIYGSVKSRFYYFSLFTAIVTLSVSSVSAIVGYVCGLFRAYISLDADIFFVTLLIYAIARLIDAQRSKAVVDETTDGSDDTSAEVLATDISEENIADDSK